MADIIVGKWAQLMITPAELKIVATTIAVVIFLHYIIKQWLYRRTKLKRAPGPFPIWPVLGSLLLLGRLPHRAFYQLSKKYGDIMELKLGSVRTIVVSSPELAKEVLKVHDLIFASRPDIAAPKIIFNDRDIAFAPYGNRWRHLKKVIMLELLTAKKLEASKHVRDEELSSLMHQIFEDCKSRITNLNRSTSHLKQMNATLFSTSDYVPYLKPFDVQGLVPQFNQTRLRFDRLFDRIIQEHLKEKKRPDESKDFLDVMLSLPGVDGVSDRIDDSTIRAVVNELLAVGTDTTSIAVEWALVQLLKHPDITKKAQDELDDVVGHERVVDERDIPQLKYLQAVVTETLRLHPPAPLLLPHESTEACEVGGYHIPAKTRIFVNVWAVHRHPSAYENPLDFNPERFVGSGLDMKGTDFQLLPFGSGRRMCPGMDFSVLMVQIILARLLHSFNWTLPEGENPQDIDMQELFGGTIPKAIPLEAVASARLPLHLYTAKTLTQCS
ncbi:hypothetical protein CY35_01G125400 [Sphagnum magellanicum]|nr:hypothetical protein CY35_01G125400 [Sphagnum magellanicum]